MRRRGTQRSRLLRSSRTTNLFQSDAVLISTSDVRDVSLPALSVADDTILMVWQAKDPEGYWQIYGQAFTKLRE